MLNVIYVGLVLSNAISSNLGPTSAYLYSARLQYTGEWQVQCYDSYDDRYISFEFSLNFQEYLQFNDTNTYRIDFESYSLYTKVSTYERDGASWDLYDSEWFNSTLTMNITLDDFTDMSKFLVRPASTPNGLYIYLSYGVTNIGYFALSDVPYDIEVFSTVKFDDSSLFYNNINYINGVIASQNYYDGYNDGYNDGNNNGYQNGYTAGYTEGATQDETAVAIFSGIISVGLIPINFFLACLNFEVFGINIGAFVSALLTIAIVVIITRMIVSGGNGGDK